MLPKILLCALVVTTLLSSCSSVYKTGQTPDDVYFSPTNTINEEYKKEDKRKVEDEYTYTQEADNYLRMKSRNYNKWNVIEDRNYWYSYNCDCKCNNNFSTYYKYNNYINWSSWYTGNGSSSWTSYNNGWGYYNPVYKLPTTRPNTGSKANVGGYLNTSFSNKNNTPSSKNGKGFGNLIKTILGGTTTNGTTTNSYDRPVRSFENTSPSSTSSGNSSSGRSSTGTSTTTGRGSKG